jgi:hypothetical protein
MLERLKKIVAPTEPTGPDPFAEFAEQDAEHERERAAIDADTAEDRREEAAENAAIIEFESGRDAYPKLVNDPDATPEDIAAARKRFQTARDAKNQTAAARAAGQLKRGDLKARREALDQAKRALDVEKAQAGYLVDIAAYAEAFYQAAQCEQRVYQRLRSAPPDAGLVPVTCPVGIFRPMDSPDGRKISIFRDDFLKALALAYPEVLPKAIPDKDLVAQLLAEVEAWRAKGSKTLSFAGRPLWHQVGGWSTGGIDELDLLCGRTRRELHGLV